MTTPAQNINGSLVTPASLWRQSYDAAGNPTTYKLMSSGTFTGSKRSFIRPASKTNKLDASGWRAPSSYNLTRESYHANSAQTVAHYLRPNGNPFFSDYCIDGYGLYVYWERPISYDESLVDRSVSIALTALKGQGVNFGVAFGEAKETAALITNAVTSIAKQVRKFKHGRPNDWAKVLKFQKGGPASARGGKIPSAWLETQYGWNPLMHDVNSAVNQLSSKASGGHPFRVHVHGKAKSSLNASRLGQQNWTNAAVRLDRTGRNFARVDLYYELASPLLATASSLGLTNPLEIAWELMPYSFVLDWFVPVGNWIGTLDADFGWKFLAGTAVRGYEFDVVGTGIVDKSNDKAVSYTGVVNSRQSCFSFARTVYPSSPRAGFPSFKNPLSLGHVANGLSLLLNAFH